MITGNSCVFAMQGSGDVDSLGNPFGFFSTPLAQHTPSYPLLVTTQMSRDRSVDQLILMSDGRYLSSTTSSMTLRLVSYNADAQSLAFVWFPFAWQAAGVIVGGPPYILALPVLAYSSYGYSRSVKPVFHDLGAKFMQVVQDADISYSLSDVCIVCPISVLLTRSVDRLVVLSGNCSRVELHNDTCHQ